MGACAAKSAKLNPTSDTSGEGTSSDAATPKKKKVKKKKLNKSQQEVEAVLNHLSVPEKAVKKFLLFFKKMDEDVSGSISLEEFIEFLELESCYVPFIERCFGAMDFNKKGGSAGNLDPTEFTVGLYNLCIMTKDLLEEYVFELYDEVHDGNLYQHQIEKMVAESSAHVPEAIKKLCDAVFGSLDKDGDGHISRKEFLGLDSKTESLLRPMYLMQDTLQKRCLGTSFWDDERVRMQEMMKKLQQQTIIDLLANRIAAKYEAERVKKLGKKMDVAQDIVQKEKRKLVKGFDSERNLPGSQNIEVEGGKDKPIFAGALKAQEEEHKRKTQLKKAKLAEKKAARAKEAAENGEVPETTKRKSTKKHEPKDEGFVSVKGMKKQADKSQSWAMAHTEELAAGKK